MEPILLLQSQPLMLMELANGWRPPAGKCRARFACGLALALLAAGFARAAEETPEAEPPRMQLHVPHHTAPIRALAFARESNRLYSAGMDKQVHVWDLGAARTKGVIRERAPDAEQALELKAAVWGYGGTLRWEVGEGLFGSIYGLAAGDGEQGVVIGGFSYRGNAGDLLRMHPVSGELLHWEHDRHAQTVAALAATADGRRLLSRDLTGRTLVRPFARGEPRELSGAADRLTVPFRPLAVVGSRYVLLPVHVDNHTSGAPVWQLAVYDLSRLGADLAPLPPTTRLAERFFGRELVLAGSPDGRRFAAADGTRRLVVIGDTTGAPSEWRTTTLAEGRNYSALAWSTEGRLLAGTFDLPNQPGTVQLWNTERKQLLRSREVGTHVWACAASPDGRWLAYVAGGGNDLVIEETENAGRRSVISGGRQIQQLAAAGAGFGMNYSAGGTGGERGGARRFLPERLETVAAAGADFTSPAPRRGNWSVVRADGTGLELSRPGTPRRTITLDPVRHGRLQSWCWIDNAEGIPEGVAIGTDTQNGVYLYELAPASGRPAELPVRWFRGHSDRVTSLAVTADRRYVVSGSADGTLRYWPLADYRGERSLPRRWGAEFELLRDGRLRVRSLQDFGPLAAKRVRVGDILERMVWRSDRGENMEARGEEAYRRLSSLRDFTQVGFFFSRPAAGGGETALPVFQQMDGWPSALAFYEAEGEWIAWASNGYYACSAGGERLVGWQVNQRKQGEKPSFFPAVRFSKSLYRPDVVRLLLSAGGVTAALQQAETARLRAAGVAVDTPPAVEVAHLAEIVEQTARVTRLEVASPNEREGNRVRVETEEIRIAAEVEAAPETRLTVMLNGSPWHERAQAPGDVRREGGEWVIRVPRGRTEVAVMAESGRLGGRYLSDPIVVEFEPQKARRTLWILAIGVSEYQDNAISKLRYAHSDAKAVEEVLRNNSGELHQVESRVIVNEQATRAAIQEGLAWLAGNIKLGDVGVIFFSGHGMREGEELLLCPHDTRRRELPASTLSDRVLKQYCQKLGGSGNLILMLDACYAGGLRFDEFIRELGTDEYRVVAMASSKGDEVSLENPRWRGGAFTRALCEGLEGHADTGMYANKVVEHDELDVHVKRAVPILTDYQQHPLTNALYLGFDRPIPLTQVP